MQHARCASVCRKADRGLTYDNLELMQEGIRLWGKRPIYFGRNKPCGVLSLIFDTYASEMLHSACVFACLRQYVAIIAASCLPLQHQSPFPADPV
jgi:hypothetical protein